MIYSLYYKDCEGYQCGCNIIADTDKEGKNIASKIVQGNGYEDISLCDDSQYGGDDWYEPMGHFND